MYNNPESVNARKRVAFHLNFLKIPQTEGHLPMCRKIRHRNPARRIVTDVPWFHCEVWVYTSYTLFQESKLLLKIKGIIVEIFTF